MKKSNNLVKLMSYAKTGFFALLTITCLSGDVKAQSDACAGATALTVNTSCVTTNYNVTMAFTDAGPALCTGTSFRDGWYTFTTNATTTSINVTGTSNRQMGLAIYSGTCVSPVLVACTNPLTANASLTSVAVSPSTTYLLRIARTNNANLNDMTGTICVFMACSPITTVPHSQGFDVIGTAPPTCWTLALVTSTQNWTFAANDGDFQFTPHTGAGMACKNWNSAASQALLISPAFNLNAQPAQQVRLKVWIFRNDLGGANDRVRFYVNTAANTIGATVLIDVQTKITNPPVVATEGWYQYTANIPLSFNVASNFYIIAEGTTGGGAGAYSVGIDDFLIENIPPCLTPPVGGTASGPSSACTGASVSYSVSGGSGSYQWQSSTVSVSGPFTDIPGATNAAYNPTAPAAGTYYVTVKRSAPDCLDANSNVITTVVNAGATTPVNPENLSICPAGTGAISAVSTSTSSTPGSVTVTFNLPTQPAETNAAPGITISTASMAALPVGAVVTSATLALPNITTLGGSWKSDVRLGLSGAATLNAVKGTGSADNTGNFNYTRNVNVANINVAGGTVNLLYWDFVNDNAGIEANFNTPKTGTLTINYSVGAPVTLNWYNAPSGGIFQGTGIPFNPVGTSVLPNSNTPGTYNFYAEGLNGSCPSPSRTLVTVTIQDPPNPFASSNAPICEGLPLTLFGDNLASGQSSGNSWAWSGPSFSSSSQNPSVGSAGAANAGTYILTVTNNLGCTASVTTDVTVNPNPVLSIASQTNVSCNGLSDGSVDLDATSGTSPFLYDLIGPSTADGIFTGLAAGPYTATVSDDNGCTATPLAVTITEPPVLTVSAGSNTPVCTANSLNLNATPGGGTSGYSYVWTGPNGPIPSVQNPTVASVTAADAGNYSVEITDANLCTATSVSHLVQITASPTAAIALVGSPAKCLGQPVTVQLTFTGTGPWDYTISGSGGPYTGSTSSNPANINVTPAAAGTQTYTVTAIGNTSCPTGGTSSGSATVNVSTVPPPSSGPIPAGGSEACAGTVMLITSNVISGQNIIYSWNTGSNSSAVMFSTNIGGPFSPGPFQTTVNQVYVQFGALGGGQSGYHVCMQGVNGCGSSINKCLWLRGVVNGPGPITPADGVVACPNTTQTYSCGLSTGGAIYTWTLNGLTAPISPNGGNNPANVSVAFPSGFTTGQLCVTAALACGGASTSPPRCMTINKNPANPTVLSGAAAACPGATGVSYSIPAVPGASGYNWTLPANATIATGANSPSITVNFPTPFIGTHSVCVTATSACGASAAKCKTVASGIPNQPAGITGPLTNICGSTVQYSVVTPPGGLTYTWTNPPGTTISGSASGSTILLNVSPAFTSGFLTVVANSSLCPPATSASRTSSTFWGRPNNPGAITANPAVWCSGGFVNFSVTNPLTGPVPSYTWTTSNGVFTSSQGSNNIDVTWGATAAGTVSVRASNSCGLSAGTSSQNFSSGCREEGGEEATTVFSVYPNPAHDKITVSIDVNENKDFTLQLTDVSGRVVLSDSHTGLAGLNNYEFNISHLSKGIYMLEIKSVQRSPDGANDNWRTKVVVE